MSDELRAAAERYGKDNDHDAALVLAEWAYECLTAPLPADLEAELRAIAAKIATAFKMPLLSEEVADAIRPLLHRAAGVRADDGEQVTEEWLRSVGFETAVNSITKCWYADVTVDDGPDFDTWLRLHEPNNEGECVADLFSSDDGGIGLTKSWPKTRGDVRDLCKALGVPLTEAANG